MTDLWANLERSSAEAITVDGVEVRRGSRVVLHPRPGAEIWNAALDGKAAVVESIEEDVDGGILVAVSVADDPARDLARVSPGHKFFFTPDEVAPAAGRRILVAGVGNIFCGDDAFGCAVIARLAEQSSSEEVDVRDFGIRGLDLAYAMASYDDVVIVDALPPRGAPGTIHVIEPEVDDGPADIEAHAMDPARVLRMAREMNGALPRVLVVGCETRARTGEDDDLFTEMSPLVAEAIDETVAEVRSIVANMISAEGGEHE